MFNDCDCRTLAEWLRYIESQASSSRSTETVWQQEPGAAPGTAGANIWGGGGGFRRTVGRNVEFRPVSGDELAPDPLQESFSKNGRDVELSAEVCTEKATDSQFRPLSGDELAPDPQQESDSKNGRDAELSAEVCTAAPTVTGLRYLNTDLQVKRVREGFNPASQQR